ncbi:MAG: hypothetical protein AAGC85_22200 [Bacteroidota bacterium]
MTIVIKKGSSPKEISEKLKKIPNRRVFDAKKYCGVVNLKSDPLAFQKEIRNDWE